MRIVIALQGLDSMDEVTLFSNLAFFKIRQSYVIRIKA